MTTKIQFLFEGATISLSKELCEKRIRDPQFLYHLFVTAVDDVTIFEEGSGKLRDTLKIKVGISRDIICSTVGDDNQALPMSIEEKPPAEVTKKKNEHDDYPGFVYVPNKTDEHDEAQNNNEQPKSLAVATVASTTQAEQKQTATNQESLPPKQPHVVLKYSQADIDSGCFPSQWLPNLELAFQRIGAAKNKSVSVSYVETSEFENHVQFVAGNKEKELKCVWTLFPTRSTTNGNEQIPSDEVKKLLPNVYFRRMELGSLCSNKSEDLSQDLDVVVFNDDFSVDDMREVKSYSASKAWDSIFSRIPETTIQPFWGSFSTANIQSVASSCLAKFSFTESLPSSLSFFSSKVTVRLIADPLVIKQGMIRDSWLRSVCNTFTDFATERKLNLNVELVHENHNTYFDTHDDPNFRKVSSGVMIFYVISAKLDREPFPPNRSHLELGYMVSERGDCDSIAIDDRNDEVNRDCNSRQYNSNRAWNKIMDKVAVKKISSWF